ncbi:hypothetical protein LTR78_006555 [Recurvomyces mirabilis]|uniref:Cytochrome P450 n=2 Tax=Recurvomyces mirabilis TaxID=574656 RepID=A0AAE0WL08_9PEZI|nr:hypothetical protein LTR78_006555 [Recurvomyces mirabilis]
MEGTPFMTGAPGRNAFLISWQERFGSPWLLAPIGLLLVLIATRIYTGFVASRTRQSRDGANTVPAVPYWLPLIGHIPNMALDATTFVSSLRDSMSPGIFTLNFFGGRHNIIHNPSLATALMNQKSTIATSDDVSRHILSVVFGFPKQEQDKYDAALPEMLTCYKHLLSEPSLGNMTRDTGERLRGRIMDFVTGSESLVDQMPWERTSGVETTKNKSGESVVEASLLPLVRDYAAHITNPSLVGSDFLANYPDFFEDIWTLDKGILMLATGLPRWFPVPALTRAHIARQRILAAVDTFHVMLDKHMEGEKPDSKWSSLDDVGSLVMARMSVYRKYGWSIRARAATEHSLLWAANANSDTLIFWMINRIYADKALLAMVREEIAPYVRVVQPKSDLPIAESPRLETFDIDGLCNSCPLLKSCYIECLRLDAAPWSLKIVKQDFVLQGRDKEAPSWQLRKGDYAHVAHDLHNTDPASFPNPDAWKPDRHIKFDKGEKSQVADMGSIRPYGGGASMCKGRAFAFKQAMLFPAAMIAMWDIEPAGGGDWKMPRHRKATGVYNSNDDTRVWVKRRSLPSE